jgi:hypothetical protein
MNRASTHKLTPTNTKEHPPSSDAVAMTLGIPRLKAIFLKHALILHA